jgi:hypothetical protein
MNGIYSVGALKTIYDSPCSHANKFHEDLEEQKILVILKDKEDATTSSVRVKLPETEKIVEIYYKNKIAKRFEALRQRQNDWDDHGSEKPNLLSIDNAQEILSALLNLVVETGSLWLTPFISSDEDGKITVEWHKGSHELHLEIGEQEVEYIKVWGSNIQNEMQIGSYDKNNYLTLWEWLLNG